MTIVPTIRRAGERAVLVELPGNATVRKLARLVPRELAGIDEVVAGHETVLISWEPGRTPPVDLAARLSGMLGSGSTEGEAGSIEIPVVYDGPDLAVVAEHAGVSPEEVVRRHAAAQFEVGFIGFSPGFGYLLGGDPSLRPPRRTEPRTKVPAGSLAIAGEYSAVYPSASPGGWNLIGRALIEPFDVTREPAALLRTGMHVRFVEQR
jgi:KipI family sensor histidine kinase inhibitor